MSYFVERDFPPPLGEIKAFLLWRAQPKKDSDRFEKMPYYANGKTRSGTQGSPEDVAQLVTLPEAITVFKSGGYSGVGLALRSELEIVALDFDECIFDHRIDPRVLDLCASTYTEVSPSGKGIRAFFRGYYPRKADVKKGRTDDVLNVEVYSESQFVTLTGNVDGLGLEDCNPNVIADLPFEVKQFLDDRFGSPSSATKPVDTGEEMLAGLKPALGITPEKVADYLKGIDPACPRDQWFKVIQGVTYELGKGSEVITMIDDWSSGKLGNQPKPKNYDSKHNVESVIRGLSNSRSPNPVTFPSVIEIYKRENKVPSKVDSGKPRFQFLTGAELAEMPPMQWLVKGVLPRTGLAALYGPSGSGKSFLAIDLAVAVAGAGDDSRWFGHRVKFAPVIYCALEGESGIRSRVQAWGSHHQKSMPSELRFMLDSVDFLNDEELLPFVSKLPGGTVVVIDTLNRASPTADENTSSDMGKIVQAAKLIEKATGALVLLVHHTGKQAEKGLRGHSSLLAALDAAIEVQTASLLKTFAVSKSKDSQDGAMRGFSLTQVVLGQDSDGDDITSCVVLPSTEPVIVAPTLSASDYAALRMLANLEDDFGLDKGLRVSDQNWRKAFYLHHGKKGSANRQEFNRRKTSLTSGGFIVQEQGVELYSITPLGKTLL
jgi:AAA domain